MDQSISQVLKPQAGILDGLVAERVEVSKDTHPGRTVFEEPKNEAPSEDDIEFIDPAEIAMMQMIAKAQNTKFATGNPKVDLMNYLKMKQVSKTVSGLLNE